MSSIRMGVISDTHGLLRPEVMAAFKGVSSIIHAGDVGSADIIRQLEGIAPVKAVRGNCDRGDWAEGLRLRQVVEVDGVLLYVLHDLSELALDPAAAGFAAVISGHSHRPAETRKDGVLYLNPGSAGPRRFDLPICVAVLSVEDGEMAVEVIELTV